MSNRFHAGPNGAGECTASKRACPYGGESGNDNHYDTFEEAQASFESRNAHKNVTSMAKGASKAPTVTTDRVIDLKFSNKEIARITETYPGSAVLEPGRYMHYDRGEGMKYNTVDTYYHPEYDVFKDGSFSDNDSAPLSSSSTDEELAQYAKDHNLEVDQLRFTRDMIQADESGTKSDVVAAEIAGSEDHGYSHDKLILDQNKVAAKYPGMLKEDGSPKLMTSLVFELKNRAPIVNVYAEHEVASDDLIELHAECENAPGMESKLLSRFSIGDPVAGRGSFIEYEPER